MAYSKNFALRVVLAFAILSSGWIYFSDRLLPMFVTTHVEQARWSIYKGFIYVVVTSVVLYYIINALKKMQCNKCLDIFEAANDAILVHEIETGKIIDVNRNACELLGFTPGEFSRHDSGIGNTVEKSCTTDNYREWFSKAVEGKPQCFEWKALHKDGYSIWVDVNLRRATISGSDRILAIVRDITDRKQEERLLQRLNRTLRTLTKCNEALIRAENESDLLNNICRIIVEYGGYRLAWVGYPGDDEARTMHPVAKAGCDSGNLETLGITWADTEKSRGPIGTALHDGLSPLEKDGQVTVLSLPLTTGSEVLGALTVHAWEQDFFDEEEMNLMVQLAGDLAYGIKSLRTAAERRHVEEALAKSENNLAEAQAIAHLGSWEFDLEKDEEHRSDEFFHILGLPARGNGRASDSVFKYIHPNDHEHVRKSLTGTMEEGKPYDVEYRIIRPDSIERIVHARGKSLKDASGKISRFIGTIQDITERKLADEALRKSEARFRALVEATTDWIWEVDENLVYVYSSPKIRDLLGYEPEEVIGKTPFDLMHPQEARRILSAFSALRDKGQPLSGLENVNIHKNGSLVTIETNGVPVFNDAGKLCGYRGIDRDISERKKLEQKYLQAQKMEAVGQLAGGIAHDFNNILTAIIGYQYLLLERLEDEKSRHFAQQVTKLAEKASNLTGNLLAFSRKQPVKPKLIDLNDTILNIGKILKRLISEDIEFRSILHEGLLYIMAVSGQIEQVLMNLATNARDAMPNGGVLTVRTEVTEIDGDIVLAQGCVKTGKYAIISVSDSGTGMDEETQKRIFEPFFTTKEVGKGTGLGLATVYGIVQQHEGFINVYSEPGEGTTFRIYLPLRGKESEEEKVLNDKTFPARGRETILLAEDEPELREVMRSLLEGGGYRVIAAADGDLALEEYIAHEADIDLLLLDVIMPKMNGRDVYDIISRTRPEIKTIFVSGYTKDIVERKGIPDTCHLVTKPFSPHAFLWKLREVLDQTI